MALSPQQQADVKRSVHHSFEELLDQLDSFQRPLGRWEEDCLTRALAAMICGAYVQAALELKLLHETVSPKIDAGREMSRPLRPFSLTTKWFREGLDNIRALD